MKITLALFFCVLCTPLLLAQNIDSLIAQAGKHPTEVAEAARILWQNPQGVRKDRIAFCLGKAYRYLGNLDSSAHYIYNALYEEKRLSAAEKIDLYLELGVVLKQQYKTALALPYYQRGMELSDRIGDKKNYNRFLNNIGRIYFDRGDLSEAEYFYRRALSNEDPKNKRAIAIRKHNLGAVHEQRKALDSALIYYNWALAGYTEVKDSILIAYGFASIARIEKDTQKALKLIDESIAIRERYGLMADLEESLVVKVTLLLRKKKYAEALGVLEDVHALQQKTGHQNILLEIWKLKSKIYAIQGDTQKAFDYLTRYVELKEALHKEESDQIIAGINNDFKFRQKNREIEYLNERDVLNQERLAEKDRALLLESQQKWWVVLILLLTAGGLVLTFRLLKRMRAQNQMIEQQHAALAQSNQEKEVLLKEVNHRVKNNLQIASGIMRRGIESVEDRHARKIMETNVQRIDTIALIHDTIYRQHDLSHIPVKAYLEEVSRKIIDAHAMDQEVSLRIDDFATELEAEQVIHLGHLVTELLLNSLKYARNDALVLHIAKTQDGSKVYLEYSDNGTAFKVEDYENSPSFGHRLIRSSVRKLSGESPYIYADHGFHLKMNIGQWYEG